MTMSDPIADMLTRIRNANTAKHDTVDVPASKMKIAIATLILEAGISTVSCFAVFALRILVSISAIGSLVIVMMCLPPIILLFLYCRCSLSSSTYATRASVSLNLREWLYSLPACFLYARNLTFVSQFTEANSTDSIFS